jgi:catechol 2,3-dioxygenase-like lactoylglutathione lyase family enzyme
MTEPMYFDGLSLPVSDLARSVEFYCRLGFKAEPTHLSAFALLRLGEGTIGLLKAKLPEGAKGRRNIHIELSTDHLDDLYQAFLAQGIHVDTPPHDEPWERSMAIIDPDGYTVEFAQGRRSQSSPAQ